MGSTGAGIRRLACRGGGVLAAARLDRIRPDNNQLADQRYITFSWGADFADVVPLRGVILGGGEQLMDVEVSVIPQAVDAPPA